MIVLKAYFDETHRESDLFCVAGLGFYAPQAKKFHRSWRRLLGDRYPFHMSEFVARRGRFSGISETEAKKLNSEIVKLVKAHASVGIGISCYRGEMAAYSPQQTPGFSDVYALCCYMCMVGLKDWMDTHNPTGRAAYFFEAGNRSQAKANAFISQLVTFEDVREAFRYSSHSFIGKREAGPIQAADYYAWQAGKFLDETVERDIRDPRIDFQMLHQGRPELWNVSVVKGAQLRNYMRALRRTGVR